MTNRAIKYRIYPTAEQMQFFAQTFGCCRKIYNLMLEDKIKTYKETGSFGRQTPAMYKDTYPFLRDTDSLALANVQLHLQQAIKNRFAGRHFGFPRFKSAKRSRWAYTTNNQNGTVAVYDSGIRLPKAGTVKAKIHRKPDEDWRVKSATVSQDRDGRYYVSVLFEFERTVIPVPVSGNAVGLDYKSDGLFADSEGRICGSTKYYRRSQKKLAKLQRRLARKEPGSKNREKARIKAAKLQKHTADQRKDFLHKLSTETANLYDVVCVESLNMRAMSNAGFGNGKATLDNGYGMFLNMLEYKLADRGKHFVKVDKWFPSSRICSVCGRRHPEMKELSVRTMHCQCGYTADRDVNAAINIKKEGLRLLMAD